MQESKCQTKKVGWASNPWFDIDVDEIFIPFDEIDKMGDLMYPSMHNFRDIECQSDDNHGSDGKIACESMFGVEQDEEQGEDKDLHVILEIPPPRQAHILSIIYEIIDEEESFPSS